MFKDLCKAGISQATAKDVKAFIDYGLGAGQDVLGQLFYAKLPSNVLTAAKSAVNGLQCNGAAL